VAALALSFTAPGAYADPSVCSQPGVCTPGAHCHAGDSVLVVVVGVGHVQGLAGCGDETWQYVRCDDLVVCVGPGTARSDGNFLCDVQTTLSVALCATGPELDVTPLGATVCATLVTLAPAADGLAGNDVYVDPGSGDTYVAGELIWDCPPYRV
jgi:hypothetical protein